MKSTSATTSTGGRGEARAPTAMTLRRVWTDTVTGRIHAHVGGESLDGLLECAAIKPAWPSTNRSKRLPCLVIWPRRPVSAEAWTAGARPV